MSLNIRKTQIIAVIIEKFEQINVTVHVYSYRKVPKFSNTKNVAETTPKFKQKDFSIEKLCPKGVDRMASSVDPDQTAPLGAV